MPQPPPQFLGRGQRSSTFRVIACEGTSYRSELARLPLCLLICCVAAPAGDVIDSGPIRNPGRCEHSFRDDAASVASFPEDRAFREASKELGSGVCETLDANEESDWEKNRDKKGQREIGEGRGGEKRDSGWGSHLRRPGPCQSKMNGVATDHLAQLFRMVPRPPPASFAPSLSYV